MRNTHRILILLLTFVSITLFSQTKQELNRKFQIGISLERQGEIAKASSIFEELYKITPHNRQYIEALNRTYLALKDYPKSIALLTARVNKTPNDINAFGLLGSTYYEMNQPETAYKIWDRAIKINPKLNSNYRIIANHAIQKRAFEKGVEILLTGQKYSNDPLSFSYDLANIYSATMKFGKATKEYCNILLRYPQQFDIHKRKIASFLSKPNVEAEILDAIVEAIEENENLVLKELLVFVYKQIGKYEKAFSIIKEIDKSGENNGEKILQFASDSFNSNRFQISQAAYKYIIENFENSKFIDDANLGLAKSTESLIELNLGNNENWKPFKLCGDIDKNIFDLVIKQYNNILSTSGNRLTILEAEFHLANIYNTKYFDIEKAKNLFIEISQTRPITSFTSQSLLELAKISATENNLAEAIGYIDTIKRIKRKQAIGEIDFLEAKINFWRGEYSRSKQILSKITSKLKNNITNDAIELSLLISAFEKDSLNLSLYAKADLLVYQNKFNEAAAKFLSLADNENLLLLNEISKYKYAEMLVALNYYPDAIETLKEIEKTSSVNPFAEKSMLLLGNIYRFGINDKIKALEVYQKFLEIFPDSLYFGKVIDNINSLQKIDKKL